MLSDRYDSGGFWLRVMLKVADRELAELICEGGIGEELCAIEFSVEEDAIDGMYGDVGGELWVSGADLIAVL